MPTICPTYRDPNDNTKRNCTADSIGWEVFLGEFLASFIFLFSWLIIRNYDLKGELQKAQNLMKPIFVMVAYEGAVQLASAFSRGPLNPTLAIDLAIWGKSSYDQLVTDPSGQKVTYWELNKYGHYIWVYSVAPLIAALAAGVLAQGHLKPLKNNQNKQSEPEDKEQEQED